MINSASAMTKVWDGFIRVFHWSLVGTFAALYVTSHMGMENTHILLGYLLTLLIVARIVWGFIGSKYARFGNFIYHPGRALTYLKNTFKGQPEHYFGHNPAGAMMVFAVLISLLILTVSGLTLEATVEYEGPLLTFLYWMSDNSVFLWQETHHLMSNAMLALIALHLIGVVSASFQHRENLVRAMITGYKPTYNKEPIHD